MGFKTRNSAASSSTSSEASAPSPAPAKRAPKPRAKPAATRTSKPADKPTPKRAAKLRVAAAPGSLAALAELIGATLVGAGDAVPSFVTEDSRKVEAGALFVAVPGLRVDGHDYVAGVASKGAVAAVVERKLDVPELPQLVVADASRALGLLAAELAGHPAESMRLIGITGTNGKTTTSYLVEAMLAAEGMSPAALGTVSYRWGGLEKPAPYTTPTPVALQEAFKDMRDADCDAAVLEVSSAALHMNRVVGTSFEVAAFSNLSQDHLDVHETMEQYRDAKARLFRENLGEEGVAVINIDDEAGAYMAEACGDKKVLRVSRHIDVDAEIRVTAYTSSIEGVAVDIATPRGHIEINSASLIGHYNVDNIALAVGIGEALGLSHQAIAEGLSRMTGVPGRIERIANDSELQIFVDYAHTPDALRNVLSALRPLTKGRLLCVFGCGGDRDASKRPLMGQAVSEGAELAFVTSDNPRSEDPHDIIQQILPGVPNAFFCDVDRKRTIQAAICEATPNDVVLIAGKGHEDYQIVGKDKRHFDDREEAAAACSLRDSYTLKVILDCIEGELIREEGSEFSRVIIDGRQAGPGDLYVAIVGERFDGHDFCQQAIDAGAAGVLVARKRGANIEGATVIEVDDPREALGDIARMHRQLWQGSLIGITGSAGKTTTKELIAAALRTSGCVHSAKGSNNNETGVPLTLLGLRPFHDFAIVEMGMRGLGEIDYLASVALPQVAVVTNAGTAHIGRLGSTEAIARAKGEIFGNHQGESVAIFPEWDERLEEYAKQATRSMSFGDATEGQPCRADVCLLSYQPTGYAGSDLRIAYGTSRVDVQLPLVGRHNAINACCAIAAAIAAGAKPADAAASIAQVRVPSMRGEIREIAGRRVLVDCYNANPTSMEAALYTLHELRQDRKVFAVLGDMLELGDEAPESHRRVGQKAASLDIPLMAMGEFRKKMVEGAAGTGGIAWSSDDEVAAAKTALACTEAGDWILLKASRGMRLERVADALAAEASRLRDSNLATTDLVAEAVTPKATASTSARS